MSYDQWMAACEAPQAAPPKPRNRLVLKSPSATSAAGANRRAGGKAANRAAEADEPFDDDADSADDYDEEAYDEDAYDEYDDLEACDEADDEIEEADEEYEDGEDNDQYESEDDGEHADSDTNARPRITRLRTRRR